MAAANIADGDNVILDVNGEKHSFVRVKMGCKVRVGKHNVLANPLIGVPFGALFEVSSDGSTLERLAELPDDGITRVTETAKDNSSLFDRNTENQKLTQEEIEALKQSGKAGSEIVEALCSNSATFQNKTEFAQDKYKRRKAKKYVTYLTVRRPTARAICEAYYDKSADRVHNLRHDSLAVVLSLANIAAGAKVLVAEQCLGVVTAAAVERMGGHGHVCAAQVDRPAPLDAIKLMNLSAAERATVCTATVSSLLQAAKEPKQPAGASGTAPTSTPEQTIQLPSAIVAEADAVAGAGEAGTSGQQDSPRPGGWHPSTTRLQALASDGFSSCIIAYPKAHPTAMLDALWPLLAPSCTFVVYSPWLQPLAEAFSHLHTSKQAVLLQLQESWLRPYQVLPARTHPHMMCSGTGGYILSGIKVVVPGEPAPSLVAIMETSQQPASEPSVQQVQQRGPGSGQKQQAWGGAADRKRQGSAGQGHSPSPAAKRGRR